MNQEKHGKEATAEQAISGAKTPKASWHENEQAPRTQKVSLRTQDSQKTQPLQKSEKNPQEEGDAIGARGMRITLLTWGEHMESGRAEQSRPRPDCKKTRGQMEELAKDGQEWGAPQRNTHGGNRRERG